ncbi:MAG TPA: CpsB/CapC family capsule biosynthesis tyrosine phosphatase [Longimicrobiales bacterium]|nr:CpsB/CapC family capsule biosynthesis tyrosine phosphatase [Longimicrobiales bacterium]
MPDHESDTLTDIHNHLAPGVDDGSRSLEESIRHFFAMKAEGVSRIAITPHLNGTLAHDADGFARRMAELQNAYDAIAVAIRNRDDLPPIAFAQEIYLPDVASAAAPALWADSRVGYSGTRYCLIEFGFQLVNETVPIVRAVIEAGRRPIIAHPERYSRGSALVTLAEIESWRQAGAILQVNAGSLAGRFGEGVAELGWTLVTRGMASIVATDHHADARGYSLIDAVTELDARGGKEQRYLLTRENPNRVLDDMDVVDVPGLGTA